MPTNRNVDLIVIVAWAAVAVLAVALSENQLLRLALALPLLLLFTGHSLLRAIGSIATSTVEHVIYAVGLSIAVSLASGFLLNRLGALTPLGWASALLTVVSASFAFVLLRRRTGAPYLAIGNLQGLRARHLAMVGIATAVIVVAYQQAARDAAGERQFKYVDFWLVADTQAPGGLIVGIENAELKPQLFDIEVTSASQVVAAWRAVALDPGDQWTRDLRLSADQQHPQKVFARLYRHGNGKLYRQVSAILPPA
jgi:hypothetical protein